MSIQFGVPGSSFSLMPVVCVPMIRISPASRIAFTRATPRQFSPGRQQPRTVCRVASITVGVGSHKSSLMSTRMRRRSDGVRAGPPMSGNGPYASFARPSGVRSISSYRTKARDISTQWASPAMTAIAAARGFASSAYRPDSTPKSPDGRYAPGAP